MSERSRKTAMVALGPRPAFCVPGRARLCRPEDGLPERIESLVCACQGAVLDSVVRDIGTPCSGPRLRRRSERWRPCGCAYRERLAAGCRHFGSCRQRKHFGYDEHVVEILGPPVVLGTVVARVRMQLLGELLFRFDGWDFDRRDADKVEEVPECDLLYWTRILIDNINVEAKHLEHFAGQPGGNRKSQSSLWPFSLDGPTTTDYELKVVTYAASGRPGTRPTGSAMSRSVKIPPGYGPAPGPASWQHCASRSDSPARPATPASPPSSARSGTTRPCSSPFSASRTPHDQEKRPCGSPCSQAGQAPGLLFAGLPAEGLPPPWRNRLRDNRRRARPPGRARPARALTARSRAQYPAPDQSSRPPRPLDPPVTQRDVEAEVIHCVGGVTSDPWLIEQRRQADHLLVDGNSERRGHEAGTVVNRHR